MQFYDAIITNEGVRMLTAASFANKLTFTRLLFSADNVTLGVTTQSLEHSWGNGHIDNYATADDGSFVIYGSASNAQDYGMAYGFAVYGYLNSEGPENEHIVFVANADGVPTYVNSQSGAATRFQFAIKAKISLSDRVIRIDPSYNGLVSNMAFQDLLERTVTTHSATDAQVGDDQRVLGDKTFFGQTMFTNTQSAPELMLDNDENENNERQPCGRIRAYNEGEYGAALELTMGAPSTPIVYTNGNILPMTSGHQSLGNQNYKWGYITVGAANVDHLYVNSQNYQLDIFGSAIQLCDEQSEPYAVLDVETGHLVISDERDGAVTITPALTVDGNLNVTGSFNTATLNVASATIGNISSTSISAQEVDATGIRTSSLNTASATIGDISATTLTTQEIDATAAEINALIATTARVSALTIGGIVCQAGFNHPFPAYGNLDHMPIGSIFLAYITNNSRIIYPGEYLTATDAMAIVSLGIDTSGGSPAPVVLNMSEVALVNIGASPREQYQVLNVVPSAGGIALVMRIR